MAEIQEGKIRERYGAQYEKIKHVPISGARKPEQATHNGKKNCDI